MQRDWDDEFANLPHIPGGDALPEAWNAASARFRASHEGRLDIAYGTRPRQALDLFEPESPARGLMVFIHGGYWMRTGREEWSHLAAGALAQGWAVALLGYTLAPDARLSQIREEVTTGLSRAASLVSGPIALVGHSAGAHLALRLVCEDSKLGPDVQSRLVRVTGIGGVYDLRPLLMTALNWTLRLDGPEAAAESPILKRPKLTLPTTIWVGGDERPEFLRQSRAMALVWEGLGADVRLVEEQGAHHFSVLDGLETAESPLLAAALPS
ncbi:MAG: alpha/beta hydrolase [Pseudomonadota bacterium]